MHLYCGSCQKTSQLGAHHAGAIPANCLVLTQVWYPRGKALYRYQPQNSPAAPQDPQYWAGLQVMTCKKASTIYVVIAATKGLSDGFASSPLDVTPDGEQGTRTRSHTCLPRSLSHSLHTAAQSPAPPHYEAAASASPFTSCLPARLWQAFLGVCSADAMRCREFALCILRPFSCLTCGACATSAPHRCLKWRIPKPK